MRVPPPFHFPSVVIFITRWPTHEWCVCWFIWSFPILDIYRGRDCSQHSQPVVWPVKIPLTSVWGKRDFFGGGKSTTGNISITSSEWASVPVMYSFFVSQQTSPFWGLGEGEKHFRFILWSWESVDAAPLKCTCVPSGWLGMGCVTRLPLIVTISSPLKSLCFCVYLKNISVLFILYFPGIFLNTNHFSINFKWTCSEEVSMCAHANACEVVCSV